MRISEKRAKALLGEAWAQFLKEFLLKLNKFYPNNYTVTYDKIDNKKCYIEFDFAAILCSDIYRIIGSIINKLNTFGILYLFAEKFLHVRVRIFSKSCHHCRCLSRFRL